MSINVGGAVGAHLVGGLAAPDAESAMRQAATILGRHLYAVTDGETGARRDWIVWQLDKLAWFDGIEQQTISNPHAQEEAYAEYVALSVDPAIAQLPARALGYADAAEASYAVFRRLREEGVIPEGLRFQVSVPTPYGSVVGSVVESDQEHFLPIYAQAMENEVQELAAIIGDDLLLQYDVAVEVGVLAGALPAAPGLARRERVLQSLRDVMVSTPAGVECGVHFCYGDYKNRHFSVPQDLSLCVELAEAVSDRAAYVHMPADRETGRSPSYFEPLRDLSVNRLALGVIDYEGDESRTREILDAAVSVLGDQEFAVSTECGMARIEDRGRSSATLEGLLRQHAALAAPIR